MLLRQMLYRTEIRFLPIIAGYWVNIHPVPNYEELIRILCERMLNPHLLKKLFSSGENADISAALRHLIEAGNQAEAESFEKLFGVQRIAGMDKIIREKYWQTPVSTTEKLLFRGLIFREHRFLNNELKDCFILPEDLSKTLAEILPLSSPIINRKGTMIVTRPAIPSETAAVVPADDRLPDIMCLAAALKRDGRELKLPGLDIREDYANFLKTILTDSGMFPPKKDADIELIRNFLVENKTSARLRLIRAWRYSQDYNELSENTSELHIIQAPEFDKIQPRENLLRILGSQAPETWWSLSGFIAAIKKAEADFLRSSFKENHWQIQDSEGNDLSGSSSWYQFEGAYIRFLIFGPLQWLGITQTAYADAERQEASAFRISREGLFYLKESAEIEDSKALKEKPNLEKAFPTIGTDGAITCSVKVPRYFRYMAARCCEIEKIKGDVCVFRMTPASLASAEKAGISRGTLLTLLRRFSGKALPPSLEHMLSAEKKAALPATIYNATILSVPDPQILADLLETPRLDKWILQQINANSLLIDPKGTEEIRRFLMEREIFVDVQL